MYNTKGMKLPLYTVDAFTSRPFSGNPAAVVLLRDAIADETMRSIAAEMNLSETAFVLPSTGGRYRLRWFTPCVEVGLCGHATVAAATVLFAEAGHPDQTIEFETLSGILTATRQANGIALDFPADIPQEVAAVNPALLEALGMDEYVKVFQGLKTGKFVFHVENEQTVLALEPDFRMMAQLNLPGVKGVGVTARGNKDYDFVSRYFNPWAGVNEDPVTGSVHTVLAPYWGKVLGRHELVAYQASARGGELRLRLGMDGRCEICGEAVVVVRGEITI